MPCRKRRTVTSGVRTPRTARLPRTSAAARPFQKTGEIPAAVFPAAGRAEGVSLRHVRAQTAHLPRSGVDIPNRIILYTYSEWSFSPFLSANPTACGRVPGKVPAPFQKVAESPCGGFPCGRAPQGRWPAALPAHCPGAAGEFAATGRAVFPHPADSSLAAISPQTNDLPQPGGNIPNRKMFYKYSKLVLLRFLSGSPTACGQNPGTIPPPRFAWAGSAGRAAGVQPRLARSWSPSALNIA